MPTKYSSQTNTVGSFDESVNTRKATSDEVAFRDGYVQGSAEERRMKERSQILRDNSTAARGLILGIGLASAIGLVTGYLFYLNRDSQAPVNNAPVVVPPTSTDTTSTDTIRETTIIKEKTTEVVPVPQESPTSPPKTETNVNVTTPVAPSPEVKQPSQPSESNQSSPTEKQDPKASDVESTNTSNSSEASAASNEDITSSTQNEAATEASPQTEVADN